MKEQIKAILKENLTPDQQHVEVIDYLADRINSEFEVKIRELKDKHIDQVTDGIVKTVTRMVPALIEVCTKTLEKYVEKRIEFTEKKMEREATDEA
jgi:hypothetical protein